MKTQIFANNIKCSGCSAKIIADFEKIEGVKSVEVTVENGEVVVEYAGDTDKKAYFASRLDQIGYPEKTVTSSSSMFDF